MDENNNSFTLEQVQEFVTKAVNETINGYDKRIKTEFSKLNEKVTSFDTRFAEITTPAEPVKKDDKSDPKIALLERQLNELKAVNEATQAKAAKAERDNALSKALNGFTFANETSRETAFKTFGSDIQVTSDGQYVIGDLPLDQAVKTRMNDLSGLLAPKNVGGSGATSGSAPAVQSGYRPGMSKEERSSFAADLAKKL